MKVTPVHTGYFKLDGGAMFGVVPKVLWQKHIEPDENNLCNWAMRCLLVESGDKLVLIDTGMGEKQDAKFFSHYYLSETVPIRQAVENAGYKADDVTDVFLTHLHFDHCGGAVLENENGYALSFPQATYWSNQPHWDWATNPNPREKASFLDENLSPIVESGNLKMIEAGVDNGLPFEIIYVDGHTEKQMLPKINVNGQWLVFMADLMPATAHVRLPWVMGYDVRPLQTMIEKEAFLKEAVSENYILFFEHDAITEACRLSDETGRISVSEKAKLSEIL